MSSAPAAASSSSSEERARLFVALELPREVREALGSWRAAAVGEMGGLRLVREEDLHVTLCFLGSQPVGSVPGVLNACASVRGWPAASLSVAGAIWLPVRRPRVLAVALDDLSGALGSVQQAVSDALRDGGWYTPEKRPFLAHVTVARVGNRARVHGQAQLEQPPSLAFTGSRVTLFRSRLGRSGARYEALGSVCLGATA